MLFQKYETDFYDEKVDFVDEHHQGRKCVLHGNEWSNLDPVEMNWCFSDEVKIAHTNFVKRKTRKVYFRKTDQENCGCKLMYEGEEDFLI